MATAARGRTATQAPRLWFQIELKMWFMGERSWKRAWQGLPGSRAGDAIGAQNKEKHHGCTGAACVPMARVDACINMCLGFAF
jgi:hypothetical protein